MTKALHILLALFAMVASSSAQAHLTPNSEVKLDVMGGTVSADIIIPASEYAYASGNKADDTAAAREQASRYLTERFTLSSLNGTRWTAKVSDVRLDQVQGPPDLFATVTFKAPARADLRSFTVNWRAVVGEVPDHFAIFILSRDFEGRVGNAGRIVGIARHSEEDIEVVLDAPSRLITAANAAKLGAAHILGGLDHLAFLLMLLLVVPLFARDKFWRTGKPTGRAIMGVVKVVTGFTIGHSITLSGAVIGNWNLPSAPVEILIAVSVLVTAIHALRPIFPGREILVSSVFGLVHGLGFAGFILELDPDLSENFVTLAGFNVGIELVQLTIVAIVAPLFMYLARHSWFTIPRIALAVSGAALSIFWIVQRASDVV